MKVKITVAKYPDAEMAFVMIDKEIVFSGNDWDFHAGCSGTFIGGYELADLWDAGIMGLALALKEKIVESGKEVTLNRKTLTEKQYNKLMGD